MAAPLGLAPYAAFWYKSPDRPHRLTARTDPSHGSNRGSIPREVTRAKTAHRAVFASYNEVSRLGRRLFEVLDDGFHVYRTGEPDVAVFFDLKSHDFAVLRDGFSIPHGCDAHAYKKRRFPDPGFA